MDWDNFHAVVLAGNFTWAADHVNLSQSDISRQMDELEELLGIPLFFGMLVAL